MGRVDDIDKFNSPYRSNLKRELRRQSQLRSGMVLDSIFVSNENWEYQITPLFLFRRPVGSNQEFERVDHLKKEEFTKLPEEVKRFLTKSTES